MPSEQEELQDDRPRRGRQPKRAGRGGQDTPEERLLRSIFGSPVDETQVTVGTQAPRQIARTMKLPSEAFVLGVLPPSVLAQQWITRHLPAAEIEEISTLASAVIGDQSKATQWLSEPNIGTDNRAPIDLMGETGGYERVKSLLLRIEYGVLA